jgi:cyanophycinase
VTARAFALLGAGEFEDWHGSIDRELLAGANGDGSVVVLPTAAAREGERVFDSWGSKGLAHFERLGVPARVAALKTEEDASNEELVAMLDASMVFFSGGNPSYLARVLAGSPFWDRLVSRIDEGLAYAGCSAGVACLSSITFDSDTDDFEQVWKPGLGYFRRVLFGPHWDMVDSWIPGATEFIVGAVPDGDLFVGLDEHTALVGDGAAWSARGRGKVHILREGEWILYADGDRFELPLEVATAGSR